MYEVEVVMWDTAQRFLPGHCIRLDVASSAHPKFAVNLGTGGDESTATMAIVAQRDGTAYRMLTVAGAPVVAWMREGHLCVVSGRGVEGATLLRLASWDVRRA